MASDEITYERYLDLGRLLGAQHTLSDAPDELLFIVIHQTSELWLKLILAELDSARSAIAEDNLRPAFKMLSRVARAQEQMIQGWNVLATMTPSDYSAVRPHLGTSSGFQSFQYRMLEAVMGAKNPAHLTHFDEEPGLRARLENELARKDLYTVAIDLLAARGFAIPDERGRPSVEVEAAWAEVYRDPARWWDLYELAEKLVDLEYHVQRWRFGHLKTVERIIGFKRGTGGTMGVPYLAGVLSLTFFPELLSVRTAL